MKLLQKLPSLNSETRSKKLTEIITFVTATKAGVPSDSPPKCWRRPKRKPCNGELEIVLTPETGQIHWICPICQDEGVVTGWEDLIWDISNPPIYEQ